MRLHVRCPAKVNLFLSVGPKDETGYHPLHTIFQAIGLCDDLYLTPTDDETTLDCNWPWLPEQNSVSKALSLVSEIATVPPLKIELVKHIPMQSGLGGGSSDAAGLLRGIQKLTGVGSEAELKSVALDSYSNPNNPPVRVVLTRHWLTVAPPGAPQQQEYNSYNYFTYTVDQARLQKDAAGGMFG
jgi:hypothetical protein